MRLTRGLASKTNWFNIKDRKKGGLNVALSIQDENAKVFGVSPNGSLMTESRNIIFDKIKSIISQLGFADIFPNPKHGTIEIPGATSKEKFVLRNELLKLERELGGMGLMPPCSTYHRFAVGMTGDKMSSSKPETTIFMDDSINGNVKESEKEPTVVAKQLLKNTGDWVATVQKMSPFNILIFFTTDDKELEEIRKDYENGRI